MIFPLNGNIRKLTKIWYFLPFSQIFVSRKLFFSCSDIYIPILKLWWFFTLIFQVLLISFCITIYRVTYSSSNTFAFLKAAFHANLGADRKWEASSWYTSWHIFQTFSIHQLTIMCHSERTNPCILLNVFFKVCTNSFCVRVICVSNIFHI